jgi:hypothetical protein
MNIFRKLAIPLVIIIFIIVGTGCSSINPTPTIMPILKPTETTTPSGQIIFDTNGAGTSTAISITATAFFATATALAVNSTDASLTPTLFIVFGLYAKIHKYPNITSTVIGDLVEGQQVYAVCSIGPQKSWCQIRVYNGRVVPTATAEAPFVPGSSDQYGWVWGGCLGMGSDCR